MEYTIRTIEPMGIDIDDILFGSYFEDNGGSVFRKHHDHKSSSFGDGTIFDDRDMSRPLHVVHMVAIENGTVIFERSQDEV